MSPNRRLELELWERCVLRQLPPSWSVEDAAKRADEVLVERRERFYDVLEETEPEVAKESSSAPGSGTDGSLTDLDAATLRTLAVEADADPRTIRKVLRGERVTGMPALRVRRVLQGHGLLPRQ